MFAMTLADHSLDIFK